MRTTDTTPPAPVFGEYTTLLLLRGPTHLDNAPRDPTTTAEIREAWGRHGERVASTWRTHEPWLRAQAAERSIQPKFNGRFFGECLAREKKLR